MTQEAIPSYRRERRINWIITIILIIAGTAVNFLLNKLVNIMELPLYLDNVGSILVSVLCGYLPGIFSGFLTNIVNCLNDPSSIYYGILTILIAAVSGYLANKNWLSFRKPFKLILYILILTLIGGGLGTLIPWFLDGVDFDSSSFINVFVEAGILNETAAQLLGNLIMDALDKAITVIIVMIVITVIPRSAKEKLRFCGWMQRPLTDEENSQSKHISIRKMSVRTKIMAIVISALLILGTAATAISFILFQNATISQHTKLVTGVANVAVSIVDGDSVDRWFAEGEGSEGYAQTVNLLTDLRNSNDDIQYVYVYRILEDGCHVLIDTGAVDEEGSPMGDVIPFDEAFSPYIPSLLAGEEIEPIISDETYGWLLTVYKPVLDSSGKCVCYAACDVSMGNVQAYERNFITGMVSLYLAFFIVIFAVVLWVVEYHIVFPVNSMSMVTGSFAFGSNAALDSSVEKMKNLDIRTGDEIENLYSAIVKMEGDSVQQLEDIRKKNETINKMQNALILVLADIVESRDKNTGDHVRKTAAYARVTMKKMRELGYYSDEMTDEFIDNVGNSAPLHDVGKIKVSDMILNKPGRLTDEEFKIMQSHANIGSDIIDQVIDLVPESDYLYEAKNLARYHHEKWNGTGYPEGKAGEDIPLSARIMAVADVFDALISRRSYKEPFSFEQAQNIIREGAGSHFDPLVADAFLAAGDECRKIAESFGDLSDVYAKDNHVDDSGKMR